MDYWFIKFLILWILRKLWSHYMDITTFHLIWHYRGKLFNFSALSAKLWDLICRNVSQYFEVSCYQLVSAQRFIFEFHLEGNMYVLHIKEFNVIFPSKMFLWWYVIFMSVLLNSLGLVWGKHFTEKCTLEWTRRSVWVTVAITYGLFRYSQPY